MASSTAIGQYSKLSFGYLEICKHIANFFPSVISANCSASVLIFSINSGSNNFDFGSTSSGSINAIAAGQSGRKGSFTRNFSSSRTILRNKNLSFSVKDLDLSNICRSHSILFSYSPVISTVKMPLRKISNCGKLLDSSKDREECLSRNTDGRNNNRKKQIVEWLSLVPAIVGIR